MAQTQLTHRETEVLDLVVEGLSNDEIAARLAISRRTVEAHLRTLFRKTGVARRAQLAVLYQGSGAGAGRSRPGSLDAADGQAPPLPQHRRDLADCERQLRGYAAAVRGLLHRHFPLFEERVEITVLVGERDEQDIVIERRRTTPKAYLVYRILGPITTWPDGPPFELDDFAVACYVEGQDTQVEVHPVQDVDGRPLLMILFLPGLSDDTEWVLRYRSLGLWDPLRDSGQDFLIWATATFDQRRPASARDLTLKVVFPASWTGEQLTEQSNLGTIHTERLPTGQTQVTWHHDTPHAGAYHWILQGS
ncbi:MAG: helix-turn-helix domain-containing protein [Pseudonocardiaceae bacterium]